MSHLRFLCFFAHSGVQDLLCCVFVLFFFVVLFILCCQFLWSVHFNKDFRRINKKLKDNILTH